MNIYARSIKRLHEGKAQSKLHIIIKFRFIMCFGLFFRINTVVYYLIQCKELLQTKLKERRWDDRKKFYFCS